MTIVGTPSSSAELAPLGACSEEDEEGVAALEAAAPVEPAAAHASSSELRIKLL
jgi:hypothetical protein